MKTTVVRFENGLYLSGVSPVVLSEESDCIHFINSQEAYAIIESNRLAAIPIEISIPEFSISKSAKFDETDYSQI